MCHATTKPKEQDDDKTKKNKGHAKRDESNRSHEQKQGNSESEETDGPRFWAIAGANPNYSKKHMFDA